MSQMGQEADGQRKNMFFRNETISDHLQYSRNPAGLQVKKSLPGLLFFIGFTWGTMEISYAEVI